MAAPCSEPRPAFMAVIRAASSAAFQTKGLNEQLPDVQTSITRCVHGSPRSYSIERTRLPMPLFGLGIVKDGQDLRVQVERQP